MTKFLTNSKTESELVNKLKNMEVKADELEQLSNRDLSKDVNVALFAYPSEKDYGQVIGLVQRITAQSGFNISNFQFNDISEAAQFGSAYGIKLEVLGAKDRLSELIEKLEAPPRLLKVRTLGINSGADNTIVTAVISLHAYYSDLSKNAKVLPDQPLSKLSDTDEGVLRELSRYDVLSGSSNLYKPHGKVNPFE
ncbi:type 4a pilus biogenesis protein PilO [Candidatus Daviesbacteria bacterium]|nr:type 4a pilus biogenesis protein PilO [Candidatus Daviesbacteria bacterium]